MLFHSVMRVSRGWAGRLGGLLRASAALLLMRPATAASAPPGAAAAAGTTAHGPTGWDVLVVVLRGIEYALLLLACGLALLTMLGRDLPLRLPAVPVAAALLVSGVVVVTAEALLASSGASVAGIIDYLTNGVTGWARVVQIALEAAAGRRRGRGRRRPRVGRRAHVAGHRRERGIPRRGRSMGRRDHGAGAAPGDRPLAGRGK